MIIFYKNGLEIVNCNLLTCVSIYFVYRKLIELRSELDEIHDRLDEMQGKNNLSEKVVMHPFSFSTNNQRTAQSISVESIETSNSEIEEETDEENILNQINQGFDSIPNSKPQYENYIKDVSVQNEEIQPVSKETEESINIQSIEANSEDVQVELSTDKNIMHSFSFI